jgi:hypothetical protein
MSRKVEFIPDSKRVFAEPADIVAEWRKYASQVPAQYALGTAQHETDFTLNEKDTEPSGYVSMGLYQIGVEEMQQTGHANANPYDLEDITIIMVDLAEARYKRLLQVARDRADASVSSSPRGLSSQQVLDLWAYLALAHNQGLAAAIKTITRHGVGWAAYKARNPQLADMGRYGDDCITGGSKWDPSFGS